MLRNKEKDDCHSRMFLAGIYKMDARLKSRFVDSALNSGILGSGTFGHDILILLGIISTMRNIN